jgi:hypothetical protein
MAATIARKASLEERPLRDREDLGKVMFGDGEGG